MLKRLLVDGENSRTYELLCRKVLENSTIDECLDTLDRLNGKHVRAAPIRTIIPRMYIVIDTDTTSCTDI